MLNCKTILQLTLKIHSCIETLKHDEMMWVTEEAKSQSLVVSRFVNNLRLISGMKISTMTPVVAPMSRVVH